MTQPVADDLRNALQVLRVAEYQSRQLGRTNTVLLERQDAETIDRLIWNALQSLEQEKEPVA